MTQHWELYSLENVTIDQNLVIIQSVHYYWISSKELFETTLYPDQENQNLIELSDWLLPMRMNG
ncbi:hypothetical protein D7151_06165 [Vibrio cholerae]|nr:hypothetical protein [Vibrio cholerae]